MLVLREIVSEKMTVLKKFVQLGHLLQWTLLKELQICESSCTNKYSSSVKCLHFAPLRQNENFANREYLALIGCPSASTAAFTETPGEFIGRF
jgi:hypothetical protein